jgi:ABC-type dipeptide/oligopeptide/nickel transport system permease subunit
MTSVAEPVETAAPALHVVGRTPFQLFWRRFRQDRAAFFGLAIIALLAILAIFADLIDNIPGHGPQELFKSEVSDEFGLPKGPNGDFYFGGDAAGRDLFVRVIHGARTSLLVSVVATGVAITIGVVVGLAAGYFRGFWDTLLARASDIVLALPQLLIAIGITAACNATATGCLGGTIKPGVPLVIIVIALFGWPYVARIVRGQALSLREKEFVEAARSLGASDLRIMFREMLPNLIAPIIVLSTLLIPANILFEAALSFLGLGVPDRTPSWGGMLRDASQLFDVAWWLMVFPGIFLLLTTLAFNLLGDGLRDALDPKSDR